jgi:hypothetical protein
VNLRVGRYTEIRTGNSAKAENFADPALIY